MVEQSRPCRFSILSGAVIGFAAGTTGISGAILLAPLMLTFGWAGVRQTAALTAAFNLLNSAAAFVGIWMRHATFLIGSPWWPLAVACGGLSGSWLGVGGLPTRALRYGLAVLLVAAGARMLFD